MQLTLSIWSVGRRSAVALLLLLLLALPRPAKAQVSGASPNGIGVPFVGIYCANSAGAAVVCNFGSGGSGSTAAQGAQGTVAGAWFDQLVLGGALVGSTNRLPVTDNNLAAAVVPYIGAAAAADAIQAGGVYNSGGITLTTGQGAAFQLTPTGALQVSDQNFALAGATASGLRGLFSMGLVSATNAPGYIAGQTQPLTLNTYGRLLVSLGAAGNVNPHAAAAPSSPGSVGYSPLIICGYNSTPLVLTSGQGAQCAQDSTGAEIVDAEVQKATYFAAGTQTLAAGATDVFQVCGVAGKKLRIRQAMLQGTATTAGGVLASIVKRSSASSGGSSASITSIPADSAYAASAASVLQFSANPTTLGTGVGTVKAAYMQFQLQASSAAATTLSFGAPNGDTALVLNSAAECATVNFGGATIPSGAVLALNLEYTLE